MFLLLVTPSELVNLYFYAVKPVDTHLLREITIVTNAMQTANFSFNFILYLTVNAQFRAAVADALHCPERWWSCWRRLPTTSTAVTFGTVLPSPAPSPAPPPSPAVTSMAAGLVAVETVSTAVVDERPQDTVNVVDIHFEHTGRLRSRDNDDNYC